MGAEVSIYLSEQGQTLEDLQSSTCFGGGDLRPKLGRDPCGIVAEVRPMGELSNDGQRPTGQVLKRVVLDAPSLPKPPRGADLLPGLVPSVVMFGLVEFHEETEEGGLSRPQVQALEKGLPGWAR